MVDRMVTGRLSTKLLKVCGIYAEYALFTISPDDIPHDHAD
jgi:hypothetical protein